MRIVDLLPATILMLLLPDMLVIVLLDRMPLLVSGLVPGTGSGPPPEPMDWRRPESRRTGAAGRPRCCGATRLSR